MMGRACFNVCSGSGDGRRQYFILMTAYSARHFDNDPTACAPTTQKHINLLTTNISFDKILHKTKRNGQYIILDHHIIDKCDGTETSSNREILWCPQCTALQSISDVEGDSLLCHWKDQPIMTWHGLTTPRVPDDQCDHAPPCPRCPRCPLAPVRPLTTGHIVLLSPATLHLSTLGWQQTRASNEGYPKVCKHLLIESAYY